MRLACIRVNTLSPRFARELVVLFGYIFHVMSCPDDIYVTSGRYIRTCFLIYHVRMIYIYVFFVVIDFRPTVKQYFLCASVF